MVLMVAKKKNSNKNISHTWARKLKMPKSCLKLHNREDFPPHHILFLAWFSATFSDHLHHHVHLGALPHQSLPAAETEFSLSCSTFKPRSIYWKMYYRHLIFFHSIVKCRKSSQLPQSIVSTQGIHEACLSPTKTRQHHVHPLQKTENIYMLISRHQTRGIPWRPDENNCFMLFCYHQKEN